MIVGREGCGGTAEGALLDDSCKFAGGVSLIVGREGCDDVAAGAIEGVVVAEPVAIAGPVIDCVVVEGALLEGDCEFAGKSVSRARR